MVIDSFETINQDHEGALTSSRFMEIKHNAIRRRHQQSWIMSFMPLGFRLRDRAMVIESFEPITWSKKLPLAAGTGARAGRRERATTQSGGVISSAR